MPQPQDRGREWPPATEWYVNQPLPEIAPDGADPSVDVIIVKVAFWTVTDQPVRFALIQRTQYEGRWWDVTETDTCHDVDAHLHQYLRSTDAREPGRPRLIAPIHTLEDVQSAYNEAEERVFGHWDEYKARWRDG